jgi:hypothetical protein
MRPHDSGPPLRAVGTQQIRIFNFVASQKSRPGNYGHAAGILGNP